MLQALSPLDGRYAAQTEPLRAFFSEAALIKFRVHAEIEWLLMLSQSDEVLGVRAFDLKELNSRLPFYRLFSPTRYIYRGSLYDISSLNRSSQHMVSHR